MLTGRNFYTQNIIRLFIISLLENLRLIIIAREIVLIKYMTLSG